MPAILKFSLNDLPLSALVCTDLSWCIPVVVGWVACNDVSSMVSFTGMISGHSMGCICTDNDISPRYNFTIACRYVSHIQFSRTSFP